MLYNQDFYTDLIGYLGIEPGNGDPQTDFDVLKAINKGLQKCFIKGPFFMRRGPGACVFPNPVQVSFNVTNGSTAITGITGWTSQMVGCTVRISGEPGDNEFIDQNTLVVPISQSTGSVTGVVYFNCFTLPPGCTGVAGDVYLDGWRQLDPLFYEEHQVFADTHAKEFLDYSGAYILQNSAYQRLKVGVPVGYYIRPASVQAGPTFLNQLRVWPLPGNSHTVTWISEFSAPKLTLASLEIGNPMPTATLVTPIPGDCHESSWLPLARMALSAHPHFLESKRAYIAVEASEALDYLKLLTPQRQTGAFLRPRTALPNGVGGGRY